MRGLSQRSLAAAQSDPTPREDLLKMAAAQYKTLVKSHRPGREKREAEKLEQEKKKQEKRKQSQYCENCSCASCKKKRRTQ